MNTIDELLYYCREIEPVGALLLTGEWGCGKTHLIEHELKNALTNENVVLRISLFGISLPEEIHSAVKYAWIKAYCNVKGVGGVAEVVGKGKKAIAKLEFLPEWVRGIASTDATVFFPISKKIEDKSVILVFDDLERCRMSSVDVLGVINDYCENQKYHTIIVANQEKIKTKQEPTQINAEIQVMSSQNRKVESDEKKATLTIYKPPQVEQGEISYTEIKEKIIQRTVQYLPDYPKIVQAVIEEMKYEDGEYKAFVEKCEEGLLELFAPDRNVFGYVQERKQGKPTEKGMEQPQRRPHNIRSLKCAISDFYRVYSILHDNDFTNIADWFYSFTSYVISYKADIAKEGYYGTLFSDGEVRKLYPVFQNQYMFDAVKQWILHGVWNADDISHEIEIIKKRKEAQKPCEIIKVNRIMDVDEEIIDKGFEDFLNSAYEGSLTLDDYVLFIENSSWARCYGYAFPVAIDWDKVKGGVGKRIESLKEALPECQILFHVIGDDNEEHFTDEEWGTYKLISDFALSDGLMFFKNRKLYIEKMKELASSSFVIIQNKRFNIFDEKMAMVTAQAFAQDNNAGKKLFVNYFKDMWKCNIESPDIEIEESLKGFSKLRDLLKEQIQDSQMNKKTFAVLHTEGFIQAVEELIVSKCTEKAQEPSNG
ncbi:MAG: P-loop NTPase fold protein [Lutisporaceae bacterium]